jgi:hypothetical protein
MLCCSMLSLSEVPSEIWGSSNWLLFVSSTSVFVFSKFPSLRKSVLFNLLLIGRGLFTLGDKILSHCDLLGGGVATLE